MKVPALLTAWVAFTMCLSAYTSASDKVDFSGKFVPEREKHASDKIDSTLEIAQTQDAIEITRAELGKKTFSRCPLNGPSEGDYTSPGGMSGKCKGQLKGKYIILDSTVPIRPKPWRENAPPLTVHTKEKWQLSADAKTLTIKSDVEFPNFPSDISAAVAGTTSGTRKYKRTSP